MPRVAVVCRNMLQHVAQPNNYCSTSPVVHVVKFTYDVRSEMTINIAQTSLDTGM